MALNDYYDIPIVGNDPDIPNLHLFEGEFQKFMKGSYTLTLEEDWERYYAQFIPRKRTVCPHGKTVLTCSDCYFGK